MDYNNNFIDSLVKDTVYIKPETKTIDIDNNNLITTSIPTYNYK